MQAIVHGAIADLRLADVHLEGEGRAVLAAPDAIRARLSTGGMMSASGRPVSSASE